MFAKVTASYRDSVEVDITTKTAPDTFPLSTNDIDNLADGHALAPGSTLLVTSTGTIYVLNDKLEWDNLL